jgi:hypothetical protein
MEAERIRRMLEARPFRPFVLLLPSDRKLEVPHPEFMSISPGGHAAIVWRKDGVEEFFDLRWVVSAREKPRRASRR